MPRLAPPASARHWPPMKTATLLLAGATGALTPVAATAAPEPEGVPADLPGVLVTARLDSVPAFELPPSLDVVDLQAGSARPRSDVSAVLSGIPRPLGRARANRAPGTQPTIPGSGARSTSAVRGV